jgi:hypothetical protein
MESAAVAQNSTVSRHPELPADLGAARPGVDATVGSSTQEKQPAAARRGPRRLSRSLIVFCMGVGATLAWQAYGDTAREMIANLSPQLGWLAPATESSPQTAADAQAPAAAGTAPAEVQQLAAAIDSVRQSVDQLAAQLAAGQRKVADDIAKLHSDQQEMVRKVSMAAARAAAAPARKPAAPPASATASPPASAPAPASTSAQAR